MMTYEEFLEKIKRKAHDELNYDYDKMELRKEGYTTDDPEQLEYIRDCNLRYLHKKSDVLLSDFLFLNRPQENNAGTVQRIAVRLLYGDMEKDEDFEKFFDDIVRAERALENAGIDYNLINKRATNTYDDIRDQLILRPLNYKNHKYELNNCVFYKRIGDVVLVLYQVLGAVQNKMQSTLTTSKINKSELDIWGMSGKEEEILKDALINTMKKYPACVFDKTINEEVDFLEEEFTREDITITGRKILLSTFEHTNGAAALFYPGVVGKMMKIMGGPFVAVFMNINDVMIFDVDDPAARLFARTASSSTALGEMLSGKRYMCNENGINPIKN